LTTLASFELVDIEINAFLTYSEIKEFVSRVFLINLVKIKSSSVSKCLFKNEDKSLIVITAFLLKEDLKLSTCFIISLTKAFPIKGVR
jgi:hypothetical protein